MSQVWWALLPLALASGATSPALVRDPLPVPDIPGYLTLKGDFHSHTIFCDGEVWPALRVKEAWHDGLDVIAITDHNGVCRPGGDVTLDRNRPSEVAREMGDEMGILVVPGVELGGGPVHCNVLFTKDANAFFGVPLRAALQIAKEQHAFVQWNHPGWKAGDGPPPLAEARAAGLLQGVEVVNGVHYFAAAAAWAEEAGLTLVADSDAHLPVAAQFQPRERPVTLLFARSRDLAGVREALFERRTIAWMGGEAWGAAVYLEALWRAAVRIENPQVNTARGKIIRVSLRNLSAIPFHIRVSQGPGWFRASEADLPAERIAVLQGGISQDAPVGRRPLELEVEITNLHPAPGRNLATHLPVQLNVGP